MNRYNEIFKTIAEVLALFGGIYQLNAYKLGDNWIYWVFLSLWVIYLGYEFYVKLNFLRSAPAYTGNELRLSHIDDEAFRYVNLLAGLMVLCVLVWLLFTRLAVVEGGEWLFLVLCFLYMVYATIHIPTIWLEVEEGSIKGSQLREKIMITAIQEAIIGDQSIKIICKDGVIHKVKYLSMHAETKAQSCEFFNSYLEDPGQRVVVK